MMIDKGVPIPKKKNPGRNRDFDDIGWEQLEVGDSFLIDSMTSGGLRKRAEACGIKIEIRATAYKSGQYATPGNKIPIQFRVWRVK